MQSTIKDYAHISELNGYAQEAFTSGSTDRVGRAIHESLLNQLRRGNQPEGQIIGVTDKRVMLTSVNAETHEERRQLARNAGRLFAAESCVKGEALLFLGCTSVGVGHNDPGTEYAITFVQDLSTFREADSRETLANGFRDSEILMFLDELRNNAVVDTPNDGDLCVSQEQYDQLSDDDKVGKTAAVNYLLLDTLIGSIPSFPFVQNGGLESEDN